MFADVTTAPDGTVYGVQRPAANRLVFGRVLPSGFAPSTQVELVTSHIVYPRIAMGGAGAVVCVCVTGHDDHARLVTSAGLQRDLGLVASGGQPVAIRSGMFGGVEVAVVLTPDGSQYDTLGINTELTFATPSSDGPWPIPIGSLTTSGGFLDWVDALVWTDPNRIHVVGGRTLVYPMRRGDWTVGQDGSGPNRILAYHHPTGAWFVVPGWSQYPPRLASRPDGSCVVAVSSGAGEFVESTRFTPMPATEPIPAIGRPLWLGWFEFPASVSLAPCNCVLHVTQGAPWLHLASLDGQVIARYVAGDPDGDVDALERAILRGQADGMGYPVIAYWTRKAQAARYPSGTGVIIGVEAYQGIDESSTQFETRLDRACARTGRAVVLIAQCYTSNRTQTDDLVSIVPVVARVARRHANVIGIVGFSGSGRPTGYQDHPEVHAAWQELFSGITGAPVIGAPTPQPSPAPTPPTVPVPAPASRFPRARSLSHA